MPSRLFASRIALVVCAISALEAQSTTSLRGTLADPSGAVIPEATVTLSNTANGTTRRILSSASGEYQFLQLPPGLYELTAQKPGFSVVSRKNIELLVNTPATLDLKMEISSTGDVVNVNAETPQINTVDASIGNAFSQKQVSNLPLLTRNVVELLSLQPGVSPNGEVLGARRDQNNVTLDGVDVNDNQSSGIPGQNTITTTGGYQGSNANDSTDSQGFNAVLPVPLDSVQEFRVTVGGQGANQGRSAGGQVSLVTKSGTNQFHGSAYEYHRNTVTAANTWFNNRSGVPREPLIRNQFGASLGGKIKKDRVFFFANWEQRKDASGVAQARAVPSDTLRQGNLTFALADGSIQTLTPQEIRDVDPLHRGVNQSFLKILQSYPVGNDPTYGSDGGLNFSGYRFNAPSHRNDGAWVAKMDFRLDQAGKHNLSLRGTLAANTRDQVLAQFPGQSAASVLHDNSKGLAAQYTTVLSPSLVNAVNFGFTRLGLQFSGTPGAGLFVSGLDSLQNYSARANARRMPVTNLVDDLTWTKGKHTLTAGLNFRFIRNNRDSYGSSYPLYGFGNSELIGLGSDINGLVTDFIAKKTGKADAAIADSTSVTNGMGALLGMVNDAFVTYQFNRDGTVLPLGQPQTRRFASNEYEFYISDTHRLTHELTLTYGLRYSNFRPPYETNGLQVGPTFGLDQYFAERNGLQAHGVPANAMPHAVQQYNLIGPANGKQSWYGPDNNNFAPRFSLAFAPANRGGVLQKIFGKNGVFRAGAAMVYDRFGSDLITQFDQFGSIGLATKLNYPASYNYTTSPRYEGGLPAPPEVPKGGFPYTPPDIAAITGDFLGISPDLKTPYSYVLNASMARELPGKLTLEVGYIGRLSHKLLLQGDVYTPLEYFKDPVSGQTWEQNANRVRGLYDGGLTPGAVKNNPALVPSLPFVESMFPGLAGAYFPGTASANYFYSVYGDFGGSFLDSLHATDRYVGYYIPGQCVSRTGCYTFFARQGSSMPMWQNAGQAAFHGMTLALRRAYSSGFSFDFNYTLSHSIDNASAAESGAGSQGASIQNVFNPREFRGSSDFDIRHNINANAIYELPFGQGKMFLRHASGWVNQIVGGWQMATIARYRSGLPTVVGGDLAYNTNYWLSSLAIMTKQVHTGVAINSNGNPSIISPDAVDAFADELPGHSGTRAALRLAPLVNVDLSMTKFFKLPFEGHRIQFRAEAFNLLNHANFNNPSLTLTSPLTFGEFRGSTPPRVMQFALRYEF